MKTPEHLIEQLAKDAIASGLTPSGVIESRPIWTADKEGIEVTVEDSVILEMCNAIAQRMRELGAKDSEP